MNLALNRGGAASVAAFAGTGIGVYVAHMKHAGFRKNFGVSGKSALPIMAALFAGSLVTELYMFDAKRNPEEYGLRPYANGASPAPKKYTAPLHHKIFNGIHDKPFYFVTAAGIPLAGKILMDRLNKPHLSLSQAILQSRVVRAICASEYCNMYLVLL